MTQTTRKILTNAFSLQMLAELNADVTVREITPAEVPEDTESAMGHADIAAVAGSVLGREIPVVRSSQKLTETDELYVAQFMGGRLPEGATTLPEGFSIKWLKITVKYR